MAVESVGNNSAQKVETKPVKSSEPQASAPEIKSQPAVKDDAAVVELRSEQQAPEIRSESQAFEVASLLGDKIKRAGLTSVDSFKARPSEQYRALLA